jgi:predicted nucleic acid-binding protein
MIYVMDACSLIAFLRGETGSEDVERHLLHADCVVHALNLCEVYYDFLRAADDHTAAAAIDDLLSIGLAVSEELDLTFWQSAGRLKAVHRISLADSFAVALAIRHGGVLITSDHHEFDALAEQNICKVHFFR